MVDVLKHRILQIQSLIVKQSSVAQQMYVSQYIRAVLSSHDIEGDFVTLFRNPPKPNHILLFRKRVNVNLGNPAALPYVVPLLKSLMFPLLNQRLHQPHRRLRLLDVNRLFQRPRMLLSRQLINTRLFQLINNQMHQVIKVTSRPTTFLRVAHMSHLPSISHRRIHIQINHHINQHNKCCHTHQKHKNCQRNLLNKCPHSHSSNVLSLFHHL